MRKVKLGETLSVKHGWSFKGEYFAESGEQSLLTPGNFYEKGGFKHNNGKERYYTDKYPEEYLCHKGDLVVAMTQQAEGLLGSTALVPEDNKYLHNQRIGLITCDGTQLNKLFAYYLLLHENNPRQLVFIEEPDILGEKNGSSKPFSKNCNTICPFGIFKGSILSTPGSFF